MERVVPDTAEVCLGAVRLRTLIGVPTTVMISKLCVCLMLHVACGVWWVWGPATLVYGWLRWQTKKDPHWIRTWWDHIHCADVYDG